MKSILPLLVISVLFAVFRIVSCFEGAGIPVNSAPIAALFFSGVFLNGKRGLGLVSIVWLACYPLLSFLQGYSVGQGLFVSIFAFGLVAALASFARGNALSSSPGLTTLLGSVTGALLFYVVTNTVSWLSMPVYEKNLIGFAQAQWSGHPSFPLPTWVFLRNSVVANALFALLIWVSHVNIGYQTKKKVVTASV